MEQVHKAGVNVETHKTLSAIQCASEQRSTWSRMGIDLVPIMYAGRKSPSMVRRYLGCSAKKLAEAKDDERLAQRVAELLAFAFSRLAGHRRTPGPSSAVPTNWTSAASKVCRSENIVVKQDPVVPRHTPERAPTAAAASFITIVGKAPLT